MFDYLLGAAIFVALWAALVVGLRDGVGRLLLVRRRERGQFTGYIDRPWLAKREDKSE